MNERKKIYEEKRKELLKRCTICRKYQTPTLDHCEYGCNTGKKLRWLESEYSDVTGWSHKTWKKEI